MIEGFYKTILSGDPSQGTGRIVCTGATCAIAAEHSLFHPKYTSLESELNMSWLILKCIKTDIYEYCFIIRNIALALLCQIRCFPRIRRLTSISHCIYGVLDSVIQCNWSYLKIFWIYPWSTIIVYSRTSLSQTRWCPLWPLLLRKLTRDYLNAHWKPVAI